ncbi:MAG: type II secretion system protein GspL [Rubrivivax sp.]|nr:type II secretion system protein GspL [Rubrivivax sp.]
MSVLAIQLPPRERLGARATGHDAATSLRPPTEWSFALSTDGRGVSRSGSAAAALLPRAAQVVLVLGEGDVSWHRVDVPKAPSGRLRAALLGVMEEDLLDDDEALHFALAPGAVAGQPGWVAVTHKPWLAAALAALEGAGLSIDRVVTACVPGGAARGHFFVVEGLAESTPWLALSREDGALCLRLSGALARALQPEPATPVRWTATPAAAAAAERWLGAPVALLGEAERALEAAQGTLNLRQFELAARHRGTRALREAGKRFLSAEWRAVRLGLAALAVLQLVGLNAWAWQQQQALDAKRSAMTALLKAAHPGVRAVLDAPLQMQRETERLRAAAGRPGDGDLEAVLGAAALAWPDTQGPAQALRFESGRLTLAAPGWGEAQMKPFRERLRSAGYEAEFAEGLISVNRASAPGPGQGGA